MTIRFNQPQFSSKEIQYLQEVLLSKRLAGDGVFTSRCNQWLENEISCGKALLTHSCTAGLEMAALLADLKPGDEVIMPSFTFVSTANAFVLRGAVPVFVDVRPDTLNLDEKKIEEAITPRTRAIVPVHYAGVGCEMDTILAIAKKHALLVIEDAAQGLLATYKGKKLGSIGQMAAISFHESKNIVSGEGGALLLNSAELYGRAEIIREKGTNRSRFFRGQVDKYTWVDIGSSFLPSELNAAVLYAQFENARSITEQRLDVWNRYHQALEGFERQALLRRPIVPSECTHNGHIYYVLMESLEQRKRFIEEMGTQEIQTYFHYVPLHSSPGGQKFGRTQGVLSVTDEISDRLVRLPLWAGLATQTDRVLGSIEKALKKL